MQVLRTQPPASFVSVEVDDAPNFTSPEPQVHGVYDLHDWAMRSVVHGEAGQALLACYAKSHADLLAGYCNDSVRTCDWKGLEWHLRNKAIVEERTLPEQAACAAATTPPAPRAICQAVLPAVDNASDGAAAAPKHQPAHSTVEHSSVVCACIYKATFAKDVCHYSAIGLNSRQMRSIERGKFVKMGLLARNDTASL